jgi:Spy/CpxP family protein refolding chaperone
MMSAGSPNSSIRKAALLASLLIGFGAVLYAQPDMGSGPPPGVPPGDFQPDLPSAPRADAQLKKLTHLFSLTSSQQDRVKAVLVDQQTQIETVLQKVKAATSAKPSDSGSEAAGPEAFLAARAEIDSIRNAANSKIAAVLSSDQARRFADWVKRQQSDDDLGEMPPPPPDGGGPPDGGAGPGGGGPPGS